MDKLVEIFCDVDDFCKAFIPEWENTLIETGQKKRLSRKWLKVCEAV